MSALGKVWDDAVGAYDWIKSLTLGAFAENRPTSVLVADMLVAMTIPGAVIVTSARDLAAVCLRLGHRYTATTIEKDHAAHPEWEEWVVLIASALGVFGPIICAAAGSLVGALIGDEAAAILRGLCLMLVKRGGAILADVIRFLAPFTKGEIVRLLKMIRFADYGEPLVSKLNAFLRWTLGKIGYAKQQLSRIEYFERAKSLIVELERMEAAFYALQKHCAQEVPKALKQLQEALDNVLKQSLPPVRQPAYAAVLAPKAEVVAADKVRVSSGIGASPKVLPMFRDGAEVAGNAARGGSSLPDAAEKRPTSSNVHQEEPVDPSKLTRSKKGIYGEIVSDQFMAGRGYENVMLKNRQPPRALEDMPIGRGIDGVYKKPPGEPPPPYVITETKYRTGGGFQAKDFPTTKGSPGYASSKQMSENWVEDRLEDAVGWNEAIKIDKLGYESWLMVVDESGKVVDVTKLDAQANAIGKVQL
ncbi:hypothetical protein A9R05_11480 [Burkholderia sp. KK1]|nr:hypothetical protein A9R05_11480 [Burkholderia sp. KK1]